MGQLAPSHSCSSAEQTRLLLAVREGEKGQYLRDRGGESSDMENLVEAKSRGLWK